MLASSEGASFFGSALVLSFSCKNMLNYLLFYLDEKILVLVPAIFCRYATEVRARSFRAGQDSFTKGSPWREFCQKAICCIVAMFIYIYDAFKELALLAAGGSLRLLTCFNGELWEE